MSSILNFKYYIAVIMIEDKKKLGKELEKDNKIRKEWLEV